MSAICLIQGKYEVANSHPWGRSEVGWIVVLSFLFFVPAHAQSVATLRSTVVDPASAALPSAGIVVRIVRLVRSE